MVHHSFIYMAQHVGTLRTLIFGAQSAHEGRRERRGLRQREWVEVRDDDSVVGWYLSTNRPR